MSLPHDTLTYDSRSLGAALRRERRRKGLSQAALGDLAGLRQESISQVENGNTNVKLSSLLAVLAALEMSMRIGPRPTPTLADLLE